MDYESTYSNAGHRDYHTMPILPYARGAWEFQAILAGETEVTFLQNPPIKAESNHLWVFAPDCIHGWHGATKAPCKISVVHFNSIPPALGKWLGNRSFASISLTPARSRWFQQLGEQALRSLTQPAPLRQLQAESILLQITCEILESNSHLKPAYPAHSAHRVDQAVAWMRDNLAEPKAVEKAARATAVSPQHLRRLFQTHLRKSPLQALAEIRIERAKELLTYRQHTLDSIAHACGYSCAPALSRAVKHATGKSPKEIRAVKQ